MPGPRTLILDNNDSFTFNLVHCLGRLGSPATVVTAGESRIPHASEFDLVILSPGPGAPSAAKDARGVLESAAGLIPVLGVCLGHQVIAEAFGGEVGPAPEPRHGKLSHVRHDGKGVFTGLPSPIDCVRYHSLAVTATGDELVTTAWSEDDVIQGLRHETLAVEGVQFHPESILTSSGTALLANFLERA